MAIGCGGWRRRAGKGRGGERGRASCGRCGASLVPRPERLLRTLCERLGVLRAPLASNELELPALDVETAFARLQASAGCACAEGMAAHRGAAHRGAVDRGAFDRDAKGAIIAFRSGCWRNQMATANRRKPFDVQVFLNTVDGGRSVSNYRKNQTIFAQATQRIRYFTSKTDKSRSLSYQSKGRKQLSPSTRMGHSSARAVSGQAFRLATAAAMTDCVIMRLAKPSSKRVLREQPKLRSGPWRHLARNARVEEDLVDQLFHSSREASRAIALADGELWQEGRPEPVIATISQETLADMVGTTRSRVSLFMNKFRQLVRRLQWAPRYPQFLAERNS